MLPEVFGHRSCNALFIKVAGVNHDLRALIFRLPEGLQDG
jgi:hypothetical protein